MMAVEAAGIEAAGPGTVGVALSGPSEPIALRAPASVFPLPDGPADLSELFRRTLARHAGRPAIDFLGRRWTYGELGETVARLTAGLRSLGVTEGTRVGLCLPNSPYSVFFYFAVFAAGGTVVNFNPLYTARECRRQIEDSGVSVLVVMDLERIFRPAATAAAEAGLAHLVICPLVDVMPPVKALLFRLFKGRERARIEPNERHVPFARLVAVAPDAAGVPGPGSSSLAVLQYTGGTTGVPKAAMLTHANLLANVQQIIAHVGSDYFREGEERMLAVLPFFHVFAMTTVLNLAVAIGAEMILLPRFELDQLLKTIARRRPTLFPGVPTLYGAINEAAAQRKLDLSSLRLCVSGGAPLPQEVRTRFETLTGCRLVEGYGLTETSPVITANPVDGRIAPDGSAGLALPGTAIEIRDLDDPDRAVAAGERGEICVRGAQVLAGYWHRPEETAGVMTSDGALRTGDVGYLDPDGFLFIVDRMKDLIICSGYNVYPRVVEEALYEHEAVAEAVVIGEPDPYRGERPKAFVTLKAGASATPEALREFLAPRLSKIEMPAAIEIRDDLPKTMIGKLWKKALIDEERRKREEAAAGGATSGGGASC